MTPNIKIGLVDDQTSFREATSLILNMQRDFDVMIQASDGIDLISKLKDAEELPDVLLLDIRMPRMNGYDTLKHVKELWPTIKVVAFSIHDHDYAVINMLKLGATAYLLKDDSITDLFDCVRSVYSTGYYKNAVSNIKHLSKVVLPQLTEKEKVFLELCTEDLSYKQISQRMNVTERSVENYRVSLFSKLEVNSRTGLVMFAVQTGLMPS